MADMRGLVALLDDMAQLLDDVAAMTKIAAKKTAGVVGDDVALNAQMLVGMASKRELPVIWAVAKKSAFNKLWLTGAALAINAVAPGLITPILMLGGAYLCFEGTEKVIHKFFHKKDAHDHGDKDADHFDITGKTPDEVASYHAEREKKLIGGAAFTDMILSAEITAIAMGTMAGAPLATMATGLLAIGAGMTVFVYGMAAAIVKFDDIGLWLAAKKDKASQAVGRGMVASAPVILKALSFAGTAAMFLVGGEILMHGIPAVEHIGHAIGHAGHGLPVVGGVADFILPKLAALGVGGVAGLATVAAYTGVKAGIKRAGFFHKAQDKRPAPQDLKPAAGPAVNEPAPAVTRDIKAPDHAPFNKAAVPEASVAPGDGPVVSPIPGQKPPFTPPRL